MQRDSRPGGDGRHRAARGRAAGAVETKSRDRRRRLAQVDAYVAGGIRAAVEHVHVRIVMARFTALRLEGAIGADRKVDTAVGSGSLHRRNRPIVRCLRIEGEAAYRHIDAARRLRGNRDDGRNDQRGVGARGQRAY